MIDEKKLIESLKYEKEMTFNDLFDSYYDDINDSKFEYLKDLIEAQPKVNEWIPIEEGCPNRIARYLVTLENGSVYEGYFTEKGIFEVFTKEGLEPFSTSNSVVAWMPLPAPYKGGNENIE